MKEYKDTQQFLSLLRDAEEYYKLQRELDVADAKSGAALPDFGEARGAVNGIFGSDKFISILKKLCYVYSDLLSFENGELRYRGRTANVPAPSAKTVVAEAKKWETEVRSSLSALASRSGNTEENVKKLCIGFATLKKIKDTLVGLESEAKEAAKSRSLRHAEELKLRLDTLSAAEAELRALAESGRAKDFFSAPKSSLKLDQRLENEAQSGDSYSLEIPLGYVRVDLPEELVRLAKDSLGISEAALSSKTVSLNCRERSSVFFSLTDGDPASRDAQDKFYSYALRLALSSVLEFPAGQITFALSESNGVSQILDPLGKILTNISRELLFAPIAETKEQLAKLLSGLISEMTDRESTFRTSFCRDIGEYNATNSQNPMKYILFAVHGYPDIFLDRECVESLKRLMSRGGGYGIYCVVFGENREIAAGFGSTLPPLSLDSLGTLNIELSRDFSARLEGERVDLDSLAGGSAVGARTAALFKDRIKSANKFYLNSILEKQSSSPIHEGFSVPLGESDGRLYSLVSGTEAPPYPFTLITGGTGSGKSALLHSFIMSAATKYSPEELEFYIIDFKTDSDSNEFARYTYREGEENLYLPHVKFLSLRSKAENALDIVEYMRRMMNERSRLGKFRDYNRSEAVRSGRAPRMPFAMFVIDEYEQLLSGGDGSGRIDGIDTEFIGIKITEGITTLLRLARAYGIGVIFSGQTVKLPTAALNQISNRIALYNNGAGNFSKLFNSFDERLLEKFPKENYAGYALAAKNAAASPSFVRMAYAGSLDSARLLGIAEAIREKYQGYPKNQVIVGSQASAHVDKDGQYKSWAEEIKYRTESARLESAIDERDFAVSGQREAFSKIRPVTVGVSSSSGAPISLEFSRDVNGASYFAVANERVLARVEQNAALAFIYQTKSNPSPTPRVIFLESEESTAYSRSLEDVCAKYPSIATRIKHVKGKTKVATELVRLAKERGGEPTLVILHEAGWLESSKISKWLNKAEPEAIPTPATGGENLIEKITKEAGGALSQDKLASFKRLSGIKLISNAEQIAPKVEKLPSAIEVSDAFRELYATGHTKECFMLVTTERYETVNRVILAPFNDSRTKALLCDRAVFGSYDEMKNGAVNSTSSANYAYVRPASAGTRLYDYTDSPQWLDGLNASIKA